MKALITTLIVSLISVMSISQTADEIIKKAEDKMRSGSVTSEMTIKTVRPKWSRTMTMKIWAKGNDYSMVLVTAPAKEKGTVFLKRNSEAWNWVPSIERNIKLSPSMMSQSWMGTDFTNDDIVQESSNKSDYTHRLLKDTVINGMPCWKIELLPREDAAVVWGKVHAFIDKTHYIQLRMEMYDEDDFLVNTLIASHIKEMGGKTLATKLEMLPADKTGHKTIMEYASIKFDQPIKDEFFSVQNMRKLK